MVYMDRIVQKVFFLNLFFALIFTSCSEKGNEKSLGENEFFFRERLASISSDGDSAYWLGSETGDLWHIQDYNIKKYNLETDRIYKIVNEKRNADGSEFWLGIRNSGLQKWMLKDGQFTHLETYPVAYKGDCYSAYDILTTETDVFVATSNGLFVMPRDGKKTMENIYFSGSRHIGGNTPAVIYNLCAYDSGTIYAASHDGLLHIDKISHDITIHHRGEDVHYVATFDKKLYILSGNMLYVENGKHEVTDSVKFDFRPRAYTKVGDTHYIIRGQSVLLSEDLKKFVTIPLRRNVSEGCQNVLLSSHSGYTVLVTENALWHIPFHLGVFNGNPPITAACTDAGFIYYLNSDNDLYKQQFNKNKAVKIYTFPASENIQYVSVSNNKLYYVNSSKEVKNVSLTGSYLKNEVFATPNLLYTSRNKVTQTFLKRSDKEPVIYLGVQDHLVKIYEKGKSDTVAELKGKYITSFFAPPRSNSIYISTLNDGVFYDRDGRCNRIEGTEENRFVRDIIAAEGYKPALIMITNHRLTGPPYTDTIKIKGLNRLIYVSDTLFYALPEHGVRRYEVKNGHIRETGHYFSDIRFNPRAVSAIDDRLYLGSDIGVLCFRANGEDKPQWAEFDAHVPDTRLLIILFSFALALILTTFFLHIRQKRAARRQTRMHIDGIRHQMNGLLSMAHLLSAGDAEELQRLCDRVDAIHADSKNAAGQINEISSAIIAKNRDLTFHVSKLLERQTKEIARYHAFDSARLLEESARAKSTDEVRDIGKQVVDNNLWLEKMAQTEDCIGRCTEVAAVTGIFGDMSSELENRITHLKEGLNYRPLAEMETEIRQLEEMYHYIFSPEALTRVVTHIEELHAVAMRLAEKEMSVKAVAGALNDLKKKSAQTERLSLLRNLHILEVRIEQLELLEELRRNITDYTNIRNRVVYENEQKVNRKFDVKLEIEIADNTQEISDRIIRLIERFYRFMEQTDGSILTDILRFNDYDNQQARVLVLLLAKPNVKRYMLPGLLGMFGNLNPVISRLINNKLKTNKKILEEYVKACPQSVVVYINRLIE